MTTVNQRRPREVPVDALQPGAPVAWGSDAIVELLRQLDIEYVAVLPGSTTRGIHDSLVNYAGNTAPETILCNHEMITLSVARGYTRVTGRPMAALIHDVVGLLNTAMTVYDAWCDRVPVLILGGTGPMDAQRRRPRIDWIHTANVQGNVVREYTKWDDQPASVEAMHESLLRAYRIAMTEPRGPVYVCYDVDLQEQRLDEPLALPDVSRYRPAAPQAPEPDALRELAHWLVEADLPLIFADRVGRDAGAVDALVEIADLLAAPVVDMGGRMNFPTPSAFDFAGMQRQLVPEADVVLGLDAPDLFGALRGAADYTTRRTRAIAPAGQRVASITLDDLLVSSWTADYQGLPAVDLPLLGDTKVALPLLLEECRRLLDASGRSRIEHRRSALAPRQAALRDKQRAALEAQWDHPQITEARLLAEVWEQVKDDDFVFTCGQLRRMAAGVPQLTRPDQFLAGNGGGGAVGATPGIAVGAGLALRDSGRLPVAIHGDGALLAGIQALWTAVHYEIPSLWVVNNNRSYYNDEDHQDRIAQFRGRPPENRWIAQRMEDPEVDFAGIARTFGVFAEGPITEAGDLAPTLARAVDVVRRGGFAVVDVWTENRVRG